jgi:hypothetical protein
MAVSETPVTYRTSDGREFDQKADAERHDALVEARRAYQDAREVFGRLLSAAQLTADGERFDYTRWREYYWITPGWNGRPELEAVSFGYGTTFGFDYHSDRPEITVQRGGATRDTRTYQVSELYSSQAKAEAALLVAAEKWLEEQKAAIERLREKVETGAHIGRR